MARRTKKQTVLFLPDLHLPYHDEKAFDIAINYTLNHHSIDHIVFGGDLIDCFKISTFARDPHERMPLYKEIEYVVRWLEDFEEIFPTQKKTFILGNHEKRFNRYLINNAPELSRIKGATIQEQLMLDSFDIKFVDNEERMVKGKTPFSIGDLYFLHGHEIPGAGFNLARSKYLKVQDNIIFGHHHTVQQYTHKRLTNKIFSSWSCGCLCPTNPDYCPVNQHIQGFAIIDFKTTGAFHLRNKMIIDRKVL